MRICDIILFFLQFACGSPLARTVRQETTRVRRQQSNKSERHSQIYFLQSLSAGCAIPNRISAGLRVDALELRCAARAQQSRSIGELARFEMKMIGKPY